MHQNAFGGRDPLGPAVGELAYALPNSLVAAKGRDKKEGMKR